MYSVPILHQRSQWALQKEATYPHPWRNHSGKSLNAFPMKHCAHTCTQNSFEWMPDVLVLWRLLCPLESHMGWLCLKIMESKSWVIFPLGKITQTYLYIPNWNGLHFYKCLHFNISSLMFCFKVAATQDSRLLGLS